MISILKEGKTHLALVCASDNLKNKNIKHGICFLEHDKALDLFDNKLSLTQAQWLRVLAEPRKSFRVIAPEKKQITVKRNALTETEIFK